MISNTPKLFKHPLKVCRQLEELHLFCTGEYVPNRQDKKMREKTFYNHRERALDFLGWLKNVEGWQEESLDLCLLENTSLLNKFLSWEINERGNTCGWAQGFCDLAINVAKWQHCHESKKPQYRDVESVEEIRMINNKLAERYEEQKKANKKSKRSEKEMTLEQCVEILKYLKKCCATRDSWGTKRSDISVLRAWQRYLVIAILTYCPIRQREIRELELGRTLFRTENGYRVILQPEDNKTGDDRDFMLSDILAQEVVADLDEWFDYWRPKIKIAMNDLDSWLSLVSRREYKNVKELTNYVGELEEGIRQAEIKGDNEKFTMLQKRLDSVQDNYLTLSEAKANFQEKLVFTSLGTYKLEGYGKELSASGLVTMVTRAVYSSSVALKAEGNPLFENVDPRKTNPHYYRNIAITHERRYGEPQKRKAFHKVLGNSEKVGDEVYNEMHPAEKTIDAKDWWQSETLQGKSAIIAHIKVLMAKLTSEEKRQLFLEFL
ncbi:hypothetical protein NDI52_28980 [Leptolyngbya sp. PL-A3]|uniref:hypothetical protein n=1 Tax=Leptolyngbya sp. PL-A3 TaxID=2933911 RepID=UPI003297DE3B